MAYLKNQRVRDFLKTIRSHGKKCNVSLVITKGRQVNGGGCRCQGYFLEPDHSDGTPGVIKVATGGKRTAEWLLTLAHEYAHFLQWMQDHPIYNEKKVAYYDLEVETEKHALHLMKQHKLPIPRRRLVKESKKYIKRLSRENSAGLLKSW